MMRSLIAWRRSSLICAEKKSSKPSRSSTLPLADQAPADQAPADQGLYARSLHRKARIRLFVDSDGNPPLGCAATRWYRRRQARARNTEERTLDRNYRKALFKLLREVSDLDDLYARFDMFIEDVRQGPPGIRPYPDQVHDTLRGLSLRSDLALQLQRRYEDAHVGRAHRTA